MSNVQSIDTLNLAKRVSRINTPDISSVSISREVVLDSLRPSSIVTENTSPFLDTLSVVVGAKSGVNAAVVDLETGASTAVAGVHSLDDVGPVGGGLVDVALGAGGVPGVDGAGGGDEAAGGDAGVGGGGSEELRVSSGHDVLGHVSFLQYSRMTCLHVIEIFGIWRTHGHHGTRAGAGNKDLAGIAVVLLEGVGDHVGNGIAVTTTIVLQGLLRRDIPASSALQLLSVCIYMCQGRYHLRGEKKGR